MSEVQLYLLTVDTDKPKASAIAREVANRLESKQSTFIEVVQSLGEYVNDEDVTIRARTIDYLAEIIGQLQSTFLSRQQIQVVCQFFCDRIEDGGAVRGLRKLQGLSRFNKEMATMTLRAMLEHFQDLQIRPLVRRLEVLGLLNDLMSEHRAAIKELGNESIVGITDLVSGEKDPRNLMVIFSILKVIMVEWDISAQAETIGACASSYGITAVSNYSVALWDSLKFEILNVQEEDLAEETLVTLQSIAIRLSRGLHSTDPQTHLARYLRPITKECNEKLQEPQHKQAKPAGQILSALGIASPVAFYLIVKAVVPPLNTLYQAADSIAQQRALLEVLVQLLDSSIAVYGTPSIPSPTTNVENPLEPFKDRLFELTCQALMSTAADEISFRVLALKALLRLCMLSKYLENSEIGMAIQFFDEIVLVEDPSGKDNLKQEAVRALVELSRIKPDLIMSITFPAFMAKLPDSSPPDDQEYLITLEGLAQLSNEKFVSDTLIRRLLNKLDVVLQNNGSSSYPRAILSTLHYVLSQRDLPEDPNLDTYHEKISSLDLEDSNVKAATIRSLEIISRESPNAVEGHMVMTGLLNVLDDPKRHVRKGAVECRAAWFKMDEPQSD
ncbi:DNA repair/transcription protein MET18/MMS19, partial [Lecanoromycetidae sp. Uapishka_2]